MAAEHTMDEIRARRVLPTKLFVPRRRDASVARPELIARIEGGRWRPLTLVVAPAGFGKTTLITQWIDGTSIPVAWLSLEPADSEPLRFLSYLLGAIGRIHPQVVGSVEGVAPTWGEVGLEPLLADLVVVPLAEETAPFAVVLDDFHEIDHDATVQAVNWLLDHAPPCLHLVVTSRVEPDLSLATRRMRDGVTEIGARDLKFSEEDALAFFRDAMDLPIGERDAVSLQQRTEGWIAGMQLAGLSLKRGATADAVLQGLSGDGDIADFLVQEILEAVPADQRSFLLDTSVLDRLSGPLCEAIIGVPAAGDLLRGAVQDGLFLLPLDHQRSWYRYHQLFGDILKRRLRVERPGRESELLRAAAKWWIAEEDPHSAASYAARAGASDLLGEIIERWGMPMLLQSDRSSVEQWLAELPHEAMDAHPMACMLAGWMAVLPVRAPPRADVALAAVARARAAMAAAHIPAERRADIDGHLTAIESLATRPVADLPACIAHAQVALSSLGEEANAARTVLSLQIGTLHLMTGQPRAALEPLERAEAWGRDSRNAFAGIAAMAYRAWAQRWLGVLDAAEQTCASALELAVDTGTAAMPLVGHIHVEQAQLCFDRWELAGALTALERALPQVRMLSDPFLLTTALSLQARVFQAAGEPQLADSSSREASSVADRSGHPLLRAWAQAASHRLALARGTGDGGAFDAPLPAAGDYAAILHEHIYCTALNALAGGRAADVHDLAQQLLERTLSNGCVAHTVDWLIALAAAHATLGQPAEASSVLAGAVDRARPTRLLRPFLESRVRIAQLVPRLSEEDQRFLAATVSHTAPTTVRSKSATRPRRAGLPPLAEPLSPRELEVLELVREGKSNPEIAKALFVSTGTIKTHLHRLMTKLGAKNRIEAFLIAGEYGLLADSEQPLVSPAE